MSLDRSLKGANALVRHRNVLTRAERLDRLKEEEKWDDKKSVFGLPKVANRKLELVKGGAKEEAAAGTETAVAGATPAASGAAPAAAGAAGKGAAAPAAGAKGAAAPAAPGKGAAAAAGASSGAKAPAAPAGKGKK
jgi:small basic protein (TIGR04137 family)